MGVDAMERKHNMEWCKEHKQGTQHRNMTVKKIDRHYGHVLDITCRALVRNY